MFDGVDWTTVLVALFTGASAAGGPVWLWYKQASKERESVRAALIAEVSALVELVEIRGYLRDLRKLHEHLASLTSAERGGLNDEDFSFPVPVGEHYNRVYQANVTRLGSLSASEATQIVRFYQLTDSVRADISIGGVIFQGTTNPVAFKEASQILDSAMTIGKELSQPPLPPFWSPKRWSTK